MLTEPQAPDRLDGPAPLIPPDGRRKAALVAAIGALVVAVLSAVVWHGTTTAFDVWSFRTLTADIDAQVGQALLDTSSPQIPLFLLALAVLAASWARRWDVVALVVASPSLALLLTEWVLKPVVGRRLGPGALEGVMSPTAPTAFPSGHETGVAATALVLVLTLRLVPLGRRARIAWPVVLGSWVVLAGIGLVRRHWHYLTDVVAAIGVSTAVVLAVALALDTVSRRISSPAARVRPRTSREA